MGFIIDSVEFAIKLPDKKRSNLFTLISQFKNKSFCSIIKFAQLIGKLITACPAIQYSYLYTKSLERAKLVALILNNYDYEKILEIPDFLKQDLSWWKRNDFSSSNQIRQQNFHCVIFTDVFLLRWGAVRDEHKVYGFWSPKEK